MSENNAIAYRVATLDELYNLNSGTLTVGELAMTSDTGELYMLTEDHQWTKITAQSSLSLTAYDINKQIMSQMPMAAPEQIEEFVKLMNNYQTLVGNRFYMLLCKDISYYTVFEMTDNINDDDLGTTVVDCLKSVGDILDIAYTAENAVEIWVKLFELDEAAAMYLFPANQLVVPFKG